MDDSQNKMDKYHSPISDKFASDVTDADIVAVVAD